MECEREREITYLNVPPECLAWCRRIKRKTEKRYGEERDPVKEREIKYLNVPTECLAWCRRIRRKKRNREK